jgi:hypothetical protein
MIPARHRRELKETTMKKQIVVAILTVAFVACGGKTKTAPTTPDPGKGTTEMKNGATGGQTYGAPAGGGDAAKKPADPCGGGGPM